jgi:UDP-N-acetylglucosamine 2-epimerase (non-hydrolysing)
VSRARLVITDSGGIQEETAILEVPCLTVRDSTERPITVECGWNRLVGTHPAALVDAAAAALEAGRPRGRRPERWDGQASRRILDVLAGAPVEAVR